MTFYHYPSIYVDISLKERLNVILNNNKDIFIERYKLSCFAGT